jgi:hypothetical protein
MRWSPTEMNQDIMRMSYGQELEDYEQTDSDLEDTPRKIYRIESDVDPSRFIAMTSGKFTGFVGNCQIEMLVDTGSELNLISADVQQDLNIRLDTTMFKDFKLRGINRTPVPLKGLYREVPIKISGVRFDHHFFVTQDSQIGHRWMVLGQPFLASHAVVIEYTADEGMIAYAWVNGDKRNASVKVRLANINDERNLQTSAIQVYASNSAEYDLNKEELGPRIFNAGIIDGDNSSIMCSKLAKDNKLPAVPTIGNSLYESLGLFPSKAHRCLPTIDLLSHSHVQGEETPHMILLQQLWDSTGISMQTDLFDHLYCMMMT